MAKKLSGTFHLDGPMSPLDIITTIIKTAATGLRRCLVSAMALEIDNPKKGYNRYGTQYSERLEDISAYEAAEGEDDQEDATDWI